MKIEKRKQLPHSVWFIILADGAQGEIISTNFGDYWLATSKFKPRRDGIKRDFSATGSSEVGAVRMLARVMRDHGVDGFSELRLHIEDDEAPLK